jgi:hypothetical protein
MKRYSIRRHSYVRYQHIDTYSRYKIGRLCYDMLSIDVVHFDWINEILGH